MRTLPSTPNRRIVFITVLVVSALTLTGCLSEEYTTSVDEPATGDVIQNVTFGEINGLDGAQYELTYSLNETASNNATYWLRIYEIEDGELEQVNLSGSHHLDPNRSSLNENIAPPYEDESVVEYRFRVERGGNRTVVDAVDVTIRVARS